MKVLLFGAGGTLGRELRGLNPSIISIHTVDVVDYEQVRTCVAHHRPDIVINCAAVIDNRVIERNPDRGLRTNIIGAANVALSAMEFGARYVYISTDYCYEGTHGLYKETDPVKPFNLYAHTKLGGECSAVCVKNQLIIRTSFGKSKFDYTSAFVDKWTSKDYVDVIAPMILEAAMSPLTGVLNLGTDRKTMYDYAAKRNSVKPIRLEDHHTPSDTSLNLQRWIDYKTKPVAKPHTRCRGCGSANLVKYLDLGLMPLANNLELTALRAKQMQRFPLQVLFCEECALSQLSVVVDPEVLFSYYTYRSGVNAGYVKHCREMSSSLREKLGLNEQSFHVDIAGNDGTLLKQFKEEIGLRVLNVDPAVNLVAVAESLGIESLAEFWSTDLAERIVESHGHADLITATNVFAHVDNVQDFLLAAKALLKPDGVLVLEFPYLVNYIEGMEFDTTYYEHLSYVSISPLNRLCGSTGMKIVDVEKQSIHGGTVRVAITHKDSVYNVHASVGDIIAKEAAGGYDRAEKYATWSQAVQDVVQSFATNLYELKTAGNKIAAFAASAKGNTLLNCAGIATDIIDYIADETPEKIGKYSPGTGIPIVSKQDLLKNPPDYLVILSWNFKDEIMAKLRPDFKGKFIVPIPAFEIVNP